MGHPKKIKIKISGHFCLVNMVMAGPFFGCPTFHLISSLYTFELVLVAFIISYFCFANFYFYVILNDSHLN